MDKVNLSDELALFSDHWSPKIVGELNGQHVKLVKLAGEFVWHHHEHEDELFLVLRGALAIHFRERVVELAAGKPVTLRLLDGAKRAGRLPGTYVLLLAALLILFSALAVYQPPTRHHAQMLIESSDNLNIGFLLNGRKRAQDCQATIATLAIAMLASCPTCRIKAAR